MNSIRLLFFIMGLCMPSWADEDMTGLEQSSDGDWEMIVEGQPFDIKGVGGQKYPELLKTYGVNSIRTWSLNDRYVADVENAAAQGLTVCAGLWIKQIQQDKKGFYDDESQWGKEIEKFRGQIRKFKKYKNIIIWMVGNEVWYKRTSHRNAANAARFVNRVAEMIREEDSTRVIGTVTTVKVSKIAPLLIEHAPALQVWGINAYGKSAIDLQDLVAGTQWVKPVIITEYAEPGHWDGRVTSWNALVEMTSRDKMVFLRETYQNCQGWDQCLGSYAFKWGWKWSTTSDYHNLLNEWPLSGWDGHSIEVSVKIGGLLDCWESNAITNVGKFYIDSLHINEQNGDNEILIASPNLSSCVHITEEQGTTLDLTWVIVKEMKNPSNSVWTTNTGNTRCVDISLPVVDAGAFRLYVYARDGNGYFDVHHLPFYFKPQATKRLLK